MLSACSSLAPRGCNLGVQEGLGKHSGTYQGKTLFTCRWPASDFMSVVRGRVETMWFWSAGMVTAALQRQGRNSSASQDLELHIFSFVGLASRWRSLNSVCLFSRSPGCVACLSLKPLSGLRARRAIAEKYFAAALPEAQS